MDEKDNESGVTEENYSQLLSDAIKTKDAEIAKLKAEHFARDKKMTELVLAGGYEKKEEGPIEPEVLKTRLECLKPYKDNKASSNLEFVQNFLALRDATIRENGLDPLVTGAYGEYPEGAQHIPQADMAKEGEYMQQMCDTLSLMVEEANGDPKAFDYLLVQAIR